MNHTSLTLPSARLVGALWLLYFVTAAPLAFRTSLIAPGNPAESAARIAHSELLYRATLVSDLASYALYLIIASLLYQLLRNVSEAWAAAGGLFTIAGCVVLIVSTTALTAPLVLGAAGVLSAIGLPVRQEWAIIIIQLYAHAYNVALLFFGAQWMVTGPLFVRSHFVPRPLGYSLAIVGFGWTALSIATLVAPTLGVRLRGVVLPAGALAELTLALWLLINGRWLRS